MMRIQILVKATSGYDKHVKQKGSDQEKGSAERPRKTRLWTELLGAAEVQWEMLNRIDEIEGLQKPSKPAEHSTGDLDAETSYAYVLWQPIVC